MITALQIGLLLVLIALIGIILGYLFGKLSCKKQTNDAYFSKNDYCESEYTTASNASANLNNEQPSILSSENVATANENSAVETLLNEEPKAMVSSASEELASSDNASEVNILEDNSITAGDLPSDSSAETANIDDSNTEKESFVSANSDDAPQTDGDEAKEDEENAQDEDENKPTVLSEPRNGKADNLCRIKGIGFVIEEKLHNLGVFHFDQIAAWSEEEIEWIDSHLAFSGRIKREGWIAQAEKLASGEETEFSKRVDKGSVSTSRKSTDK